MTDRSEHQEQRDFVHWFRLAYPGVLIFAIPNGGLRNKITAARLKAEGVVSGVPDLFIPEWRMFVEMKKTKAAGGRLSEAQRAVITELRRVGLETVVAYGLDEACDHIRRVAPLPAREPETTRAEKIAAYKKSRREIRS